ncbi:OLC1v1031828C1 [Oldenlandia corymbosa var. corymbosa]|uniref:OLC1v1031828C1 n=1 Tax=Oldenlandia corymbosa var. corymbosa TaxID=529605 RepID=A0AAV1CMM7_OLDCO|nr:OLC1v1031828C1 [Oldenlandia corymbosa var. corymbosa]
MHMDSLQETWSPFSLDSMLEDDDLMNFIQTDLEKNYSNSMDQPTTNQLLPCSFSNPADIPSSEETAPFKNMDFSGSSSSSSSSSSSTEELQLWDDDDQCNFGTLMNDSPLMPVKKITRTPLQAKSHVIAERKRREKLLKRFKDLSDLIPGLKKSDKMSIIDGAINSLKEYDRQIKDLTQKLDEERRKWKEGVEHVDDVDDDAKENPCLYGDADFEVDCHQLKRRKLQN